MKIKLLESFSGPDIDWAMGDIVDIKPETAKKLVKLEMAESVKNGETDTEKPPKLKIYDGDKKKTVKKKTMSNTKGKRKIIKATLS